MRRQAIAVQREFDRALQASDKQGVTITVHGVGPRSIVDVARVHSSVGALLSELFKNAYPEVDTQHLMFQTRDHERVVPAIPELW